MAEKVLSSRIIHKHDVAANWIKATNFVPKQGEIVVYDIDADYAYERIKIGDGVRNVNALPFVDDALRATLVEQINAVDDKVDAVSALVGDTSVSEQINTAAANNQSDWSVDDKTSPAYVKNRPFYTSKPTETIILAETSIETRPEGAELILTPKLVDGTTYIVNFNGIEYSCVSRCDTNDDVYIGNQSLAGEWEFQETITSNEPFFIASNSVYDWACIFAAEGTHTVSIAGMIVTVHQLDEKYISYKPGLKVTGTEYTINDEIVAASDGAEIFNDYENNKASGEFSHAEGHNTTAVGYASHSEGYSTTASGYVSHTEGMNTEARGVFSHAEGQDSIASGYASHAEGYNTKVTNNSADVASTTSSNTAGYYAHAEGYGTIAYGTASHAEGNGTTASGNSSHAEGYNTKATPNSADVATDINISAAGYYTHAEGYGTVAYGAISHAEGNGTTASGTYSHAEGHKTTASGNTSHAEGGNTTASGSYSHAEGGGTSASGYSSHAEGNNTIASGQYQHVQGKYNINDAASKYAHIVGNGKSDSHRANAHTIDWDGNAWFQGAVKVGGTNQDDTAAKTLATQEYVDEALTTIPAPDVSGQIETHNISTTAHSDIRTSISDLSTLVGDKSVSEQIAAANIIHVGPTAPTDPNIQVWINTSEEGTGIIPVLPRIATITLAASAWTGGSEPYSQVVEINTVTSASKIDLQPTAQQIVSLQNAETSLMVENNGGVVTCYAIGNKPTVDYTMQVLIQEVSYV